MIGIFKKIKIIKKVKDNKNIKIIKLNLEFKV